MSCVFGKRPDMRFRLILPIAVLLLMVVAASGCTNSVNQQQQQASAPANNQPTVAVTATYLGEPKSIPATFNRSPLTPAAGYKFVRFAVYCENLNARSGSLASSMCSPNSLTLRDTDGNLYRFDSIATFGSQDQQVNGRMLKPLAVQLNTQQGDKVSGIVVFQIPQSATPKSLTYDDGDISGVNRITINL